MRTHCTDLASILILSPALSQSVACARLLRQQGGSQRIDGGWLSGERRMGLPGLFDNFVDVGDARDIETYDVVVPTGAEATSWILNTFGQGQLGTAIMDRRVLRVFDKLFLLQLASEADVPVPETWKSLSAAAGYEGPVFFYKPRIEGLAGRRSYARSVCDVPMDVRTPHYFFQEFVQGQGTYGVSFLAENGSILLETQHFERFSYPRDGGSAAVIRPHSDVRLTELVQCLASAMHYTGWGLAEFKWCPLRQDYVLMEINAKLWASLELAFRVEPMWAKVFFGLDVVRSRTSGLIWLDRLLGSGSDHLLRALPFFLRYQFVWEPHFFRRAVAKILPRGVKRVFQSLRNIG